MDTTGYIVAVLGAGGVIGGIVALLKVRPEAARLVVGAAEGAVLVQASVIQSLRFEMERLHTAIVELNTRVDELEKENRQLRSERSDG